MELRRLFVLARVWLPLMVLVAVLGGVAAYAVSNVQQKVYEAKATLIVGQALSMVNPDPSQFLVAQNLANTYATVARTRPLLESTIAALGLDVSPEALASQVRVEALPDSTLLAISATDNDPAEAAAIANALAEQLVAAAPGIQGREADFQRSIDADLLATQRLIEATQARVDELIEADRTAEQETELQSLEGRIAGLRATYATLLSFSSGSATNLLTVLEPAIESSSPVSPRPLVNVLLAVIISVLVIAAIAFLTEQLDESIKDPEAVYQVLGLSTLGTIGRMTAGRGEEFQSLAGLTHPRSSYAEAYRTLRSNIDFSSVDEPLKSILVTSAAPAEGKTVTAANLAVVFAQAGRPVLLVDADLRKPGLHRMFKLPNAEGLTTLMRGEAVSLARIKRPTAEPNLYVLTTGPLPPNPAELLASQKMRRVMDLFRKEGYLVIIDSPPIDVVTDAAVLSSFVDGTLLIVDASRSRRRVVRRATETLARAGANTLGAVLNRAQAGSASFYGDYHTAVRSRRATGGSGTQLGEEAAGGSTP